MHRRRLTHGTLTATALTLLLGILPSHAFAQGTMEEEPETRVITMTAFHVPFNDMEKITEIVEKYFMPSTMEDPHTLSFRFATHAWGNAKMNAWLITEYASLAAMEASTEWNAEWVERTYPEGTPERAEYDKANEVFLKYFDGHQDNIVGYSVDHSK